MDKSINKWNTDKSLRMGYLRKLIEFLQDGNEAVYSGVSSLGAAARMLFLIEDAESTIMLDESAWVHDDVRTLVNVYIFRVWNIWTLEAVGTYKRRMHDQAYQYLTNRNKL